MREKLIEIYFYICKDKMDKLPEKLTRVKVYVLYGYNNTYISYFRGYTMKKITLNFEEIKDEVGKISVRDDNNEMKNVCEEHFAYLDEVSGKLYKIDSEIKIGEVKYSPISPNKF